MLALQSVTDDALSAAVPEVTPAIARKLISTVHREGRLAPRPGLPRVALKAILAAGELPSLTLIERHQSPTDGFARYLWGAADGQRIETVKIPLADPARVSVCVSSQAGCALACGFCATGRLGLARNLEVWEIVEQVRGVRRDLAPGQRVHGVVFQGMGEPLANLDRVLAAIDVLTAPYAQAIDARAITVSTAGLPAGIRRLTDRRVRLGLSIGSARPAVRRQLMPIDEAHPLQSSVMPAAVDHARATGLAPMWAVTLLAGVNDSDADADALAELAGDFRHRAGVAPRLTVLDYNAIDTPDRDPYRRSPRAGAFRDRLAVAGIHSHRRYSGGCDIAAACGQLAAR